MHRPMREASNDRVAILLDDYAHDLGTVSEIALGTAIDDLKRNSGEETDRWFPMIGEVTRTVKRKEKQLALLARAKDQEVPKGYMPAGTLNFKAEEAVIYDGFKEQTYEEYLAIE